MALSELGYAYLRFKNNLTDITLENHDYRTSASVTPIPLFFPYCGTMLTETLGGEKMIQEDSYYLILDEEYETSFSDSMIDYSVDYGSNIINLFSVKAYPRTIASASSVLFNLEEMITLMPDAPVYVKVTYSDPSGQNMRTAGKDISVYKEMYLDYDPPTGDISSSLQVTAVDINHNPTDYGAFSTILKLYNSGAIDGYVTTLEVRGKPVTFYNPTETITSSSASIEHFGTYEDSLDQKYITTITDGTTYASSVVSAEKDPRIVLKSIKFIANTNNYTMSSYLYNDIGDKIHVEISEHSIDADYFIQEIETTIDLSGVITATWSLI